MVDMVKDIRLMVSNSDGVFKEVLLKSVSIYLEDMRYVSLSAILKAFGNEVGLDLKDDVNSTISDSHAEEPPAHEYMVSYLSKTKGLFIYCGLVNSLKLTMLDNEDLDDEI